MADCLDLSSRGGVQRRGQHSVQAIPRLLSTTCYRYVKIPPTDLARS